MGRRTGFEVFQHYSGYLHQTSVWPSESTGEDISIASMPPRYANSARAKLLRWASTMAAQAALNIYDREERVAYVANSPLAKMLDQWANDVPYTEQTDAKEVTPRDMVLVFAHILGKRTDLGVPEIIELCEELATYIDENWTVTHQSR